MEEQFHFSIYGYGIQWFWYCNDINQFCLDILKRICFNDVTVVCQQLVFFYFLNITIQYALFQIFLVTFSLSDYHWYIISGRAMP